MSVNITEKLNFADRGSNNQILQDLVEKYESKLLYNSTIDKLTLKSAYRRKMAIIRKMENFKKKMEHTVKTIQPLPISLKYFSEDLVGNKLNNKSEYSEENVNIDREIQFPFQENLIDRIEEDFQCENNDAASIDEEMYQRNKNFKNWMTSYDNFENDLNIENDDYDEDWTVNYGTPNPNSKVSDTPCGGCGAYLHCKVSMIKIFITFQLLLVVY